MSQGYEYVSFPRNRTNICWAASSHRSPSLWSSLFREDLANYGNLRCKQWFFLQDYRLSWFFGKEPITCTYLLRVWYYISWKVRFISFIYVSYPSGLRIIGSYLLAKLATFRGQWRNSIVLPLGTSMNIISSVAPYISINVALIISPRLNWVWASSEYVLVED